MNDDLEDRVLQFHALRLPGQPQMMHVGTVRLVSDLQKALVASEEELAALRGALRTLGLHHAPESGVLRIARERQRQIEVEGWSPEHDDAHSEGELAMAAACYAEFGAGPVRGSAHRAPLGWPFTWSKAWWKPRPDRIRNLERAGALIAAEIDRLRRAAVAEKEGG